MRPTRDVLFHGRVPVDWLALDRLADDGAPDLPLGAVGSPTRTPVPAASDLGVLLEQSHGAALATLGGQDAAVLAAVTWTSMHLAAVRRVLYPAVTRHVPAARSRVEVQQATDRRLQHALWRLDRRITGDMHQARSSVQLLAGHVAVLLAEHSRGEAALLAELRRATDDAQLQALAARLVTTMSHAPTRPHPDTYHHRYAEPLTFTLTSWGDSLRDALDGRSNPTPHQRRAPRALGMWSAYLMAAPYPSPQRSTAPAVDPAAATGPTQGQTT